MHNNNKKTQACVLPTHFALYTDIQMLKLNFTLSAFVIYLFLLLLLQIRLASDHAKH